MKRIDEQLRSALARKEPPNDLSNRVLRRIAARRIKRSWTNAIQQFFFPRWRGLVTALAVMLAAGLIGFLYLRSKGPIEMPVPGKNQVVHTPPKEQPVDDGKIAVMNSTPATRRFRARRRTPAMKAKIAADQLILALHIASVELNKAQRAVQNAD